MRHVPVLIAGGGPVGLTLAKALAARGVRCLLAERNETSTRHPKMDITNGRSMELFAAMGIADDLRAVAVAQDQRRHRPVGPHRHVLVRGEIAGVLDAGVVLDRDPVDGRRGVVGHRAVGS